MKPSSSPGIDPKRSPIPAKWIVALVAVALVYALLQPWANRRFGWNLPSLGQLTNSQPANQERDSAKGSEKKSLNKDSYKPELSSETSPNEDSSNDDDPSADTTLSSQPASKSLETSSNTLPDVSDELDNSSTPSRKGDSFTQEKATANKSTAATADTASSRDTKSNNASSTSSPRPSNSSGPLANRTSQKQQPNSDSPYELLKSIGSEAYLSQAGLRYTRGSEDGHRIKHLERHRSDIPDRPGRHGVFKGDWQQTLKWIDEAYSRSKKPDRFTKVRQEDSRTIIETEFSSTIGYIGGRDGSRAGNPSTRRLRLVVEGDRFITAFPF